MPAKTALSRPGLELHLVNPSAVGQLAVLFPTHLLFDQSIQPQISPPTVLGLALRYGQQKIHQGLKPNFVILNLAIPIAPHTEFSMPQPKANILVVFSPATDP